MTDNNFWREFCKTGKVEDYLIYKMNGLRHSSPEREYLKREWKNLEQKESL